MKSPRRSRRMLLAAAVLALLTSACGLYNDHPFVATATPSHANLVQNPGFESGSDGWSSGTSPASVTNSVARSGKSSTALTASGDTVAAVAQSLAPVDIPEFVSGFYRVDPGKSHPAQATFALTVQGGGFADGQSTHIVRFVIGGLPAQPSDTPANTKYVFLSRAAASTGAWTYFGYPAGEAFKSAFAEPQSAMTGLQLSLEAGGDGATVQFDDIYAGTQRDNPNRPPQQ